MGSSHRLGSLVFIRIPLETVPVRVPEDPSQIRVIPANQPLPECTHWVTAKVVVRWASTLMLLLFAGLISQAQTTFGSQALGSPVSQTVTVTASAAGAVANVRVLTMGVSGLDFVAGTGGTCAGANFSAGQQCSQPVTFTPAVPGLRQGAVLLLDSGNHTLGTAPINGIGSGGLPVFLPGDLIPVAGSGGWEQVLDGQTALTADLNLPSSVALDGAGNIYIADSIHNRIRFVNAATHIISTYAGNGNTGYDGDGGQAANAALNTPSGVALDPAGNLYIADTGNNAIRLVNAATGTITTIAGNGNPGASGDNGPAKDARLNQPWGITLDTAGDVYIADTNNHKIREIAASTGVITTVAGNGVTNADGSGSATGDGGLATAAGLNRPFPVAFDLAGNMYIPDSGNNKIRVVNPAGIITTFAGNGTPGYAGDNGLAKSANLDAPSSVIVDAAQNLYIADTQNNAIRRVNASSGDIITIVRNGYGNDFYNKNMGGVALYGPQGLALDGFGNLYVADYFYMRVREILANAAVLNFTTTPTRQGSISAPLNQTIENDGTAALSVGSVSNDANSTFNATASTCLDGNPLAVNGDCIVAAQFAPTVAQNPLTANITVQVPSVDGPLNLYLVGNATAVNSTTTALNTTPNPSGFTQNVTMTAAVTTGPNTGSLTGTVTFYDGTTKLQTGAALNASGVASYATPALAVGQHVITAAYSGDNLHFSSVSTASTQVVNEATSTTLQSSANPSPVNASVTFTATVSINGGGGVTPDGTVTFMDGTTALATLPLTAAGTATFSTAYLTNGVHPITAVFSGDAANQINGSTSPVLNQDVLATSTVVLTSAPDPSAYGSPVTFTATITTNGTSAPSGTVNLLDAGTQIGTVNLTGTSGIATFTISSLTAGSHPIQAVFVGNNIEGAGTSAPIAQVVNPVATTSILAVTPTPGIAGKPVTLTAAVTEASGPALLTGVVTFSDGASSLGTVKLGANGTASIQASLAPGAHALQAAYGGDANNLASSSAPLAFPVNLATTAVALSSSGSPSIVLSAVKFTAVVTGNGGTPGGNVTFTVDGAAAGTGTLDATGTATFSDSGLAVGTHTVTAAYGGDTNDGTSTSSTLSQVVQFIASTTSLGTSSTGGPLPQSLLVATVLGASGPVPTGSVTFTNAGNVIGAAPLNADGVATLDPDLPTGAYNVVAAYGGDAVHSSSTSASVSVSGTPYGFNVAVTPSMLSLASSQNGTVTVTFGSSDGFSDTIGMGCLSLPAGVNCHFASDTVALATNGTQSVQLTIDTNVPLSGGQSAKSTRPGMRGITMAGIYLPLSFVFGCFLWRFRRRHAFAPIAALLVFLGCAAALAGCASFSQNTAAPGTYTIQIGGIGTKSNVSHYQSFTLTITK